MSQAVGFDPPSPPQLTVVPARCNGPCRATRRFYRQAGNGCVQGTASACMRFCQKQGWTACMPMPSDSTLLQAGRQWLCAGRSLGMHTLLSKAGLDGMYAHAEQLDASTGRQAMVVQGAASACMHFCQKQGWTSWTACMRCVAWLAPPVAQPVSLAPLCAVHLLACCCLLLLAAAACCCLLLLAAAACCCWLLLLLLAAACCCCLLLLVAAAAQCCLPASGGAGCGCHVAELISACSLRVLGPGGTAAGWLHACKAITAAWLQRQQLLECLIFNHWARHGQAAGISHAWHADAAPALNRCNWCVDGRHPGCSVGCMRWPALTHVSASSGCPLHGCS